jgi:hypothetical protein
MRLERLDDGFRILDLEAELREAALELGFAPDGDAFVRRFRADPAGVETVWGSFVRSAEPMLRQTAGHDAPWNDALAGFLERVRGVDWWLAGSAALAVRGVEVAPRDVDVITDAAGAQRLGGLLADVLVEPVSSGGGWIARCWGRAFLHARIEWIAEVEPSVDDPEAVDFGPAAAARLESVRWRGYELRVPPLDLQLAVAERRGLGERVDAIRRWARR